MHKDLLPKSQGEASEQDPMNLIYQTYQSYLEQFPLWPRLQTFLHYADPTIALGARLQLRWKQQSMTFAEPQPPKPLLTPRKAPKIKGKYPEIELVERMHWHLVASIRKQLLAWRCIAPELSGVLAGRIARSILYIDPGASMEEIVLKEAERLIPEDEDTYTYSMQMLKIFAADELPKLHTNAWLRLAEWKGAQAPAPAVDPDKEEAAKQVAATLKRRGREVENFFTSLLQAHGALLNTVAGESHDGI